MTICLVQHPSLPRFYFRELSFKMMRLAVSKPVRKRLAASSPDVVHIHTERIALALRLDEHRLPAPTAVSLHAADRTKQIVLTHSRHERLRRALQGADRVMLVGTVLHQHFGEDLAGVKWETIHNGFTMEGDRAVKRHQFRARSPHLISVARLFEGKGLHFVLDALSKLPDEITWSYEIVGEGPYEHHLRRLAAELGISDRVAFVGSTSHRDAMRRLRQSDVFVLPSTYEAFGVAHLEAMATGCVTIGTDGQGPAEFIEDGKTGFLVPPASPDAIAAVLRRLVEHPDLAVSVSRAGEDFAWTHLTWEAHGRKLEDLYKGAIADFDPASHDR